jgi:glycosyltransferase involved in cell wall biosynthesis
MRILISADPEIPVPPRAYGGIERIINALAKALSTRGHEVGLAAHPLSTCKVNAFFPWAGGRSRSGVDTLQNMHVLQKAVRAFQPHVLHSFSRILYMALLAGNSLPKIMCFQREPTPRTVFLAAKLFNDSLSFTGVSEYISRKGRRAGGDWRTVYNFVDTDIYNFEPRVNQDAPLVFLSRIERIKGPHTAIAVARRTGRRLIIAGNHATSGPEFDYWTTEILPHLGGAIEYVGPVDDQQKNILLGQAAALVVPIEWNEPFGIVFAEALACGTPVISCPRGALPEIIRHGFDGFLVTTIEEACTAVTQISRIDRRDCRKRVEDRFSARVISDQYEQLYEQRLGAVQ